MNEPLPETLRSLTGDERQKAAIVLAMVEARCRPEAFIICPEVATLLLSRKPSKLPQRVVQAAMKALILEDIISNQKPEVIQNLITAGYSENAADEFYNHELYQRKWEVIAQAMRGIDYGK